MASRHGLAFAAAKGGRAARLLALLRCDPRLRQQGKNPFQLDSKPPSIPFKDYAYAEARYSMLAARDPETAEHLLRLGQKDVQRQWEIYEARAAAAQDDNAGIGTHPVSLYGRSPSKAI